MQISFSPSFLGYSAVFSEQSCTGRVRKVLLPETNLMLTLGEVLVTAAMPVKLSILAWDKYSLQ